MVKALAKRLLKRTMMQGWKREKNLKAESEPGGSVPIREYQESELEEKKDT